MSPRPYWHGIRARRTCRGRAHGRERVMRRPCVSLSLCSVTVCRAIDYCVSVCSVSFSVHRARVGPTGLHPIWVSWRLQTKFLFFALPVFVSLSPRFLYLSNFYCFFSFTVTTCTHEVTKLTIGPPQRHHPSVPARSRDRARLGSHVSVSRAIVEVPPRDGTVTMSRCDRVIPRYIGAVAGSGDLARRNPVGCPCVVD